jgi:hypothetical protein
MVLSKAIYRVAGTLFGAAVAIVLTGVFSQDRTMLIAIPVRVKIDNVPADVTLAAGMTATVIVQPSAPPAPSVLNTIRAVGNVAKIATEQGGCQFVYCIETVNRSSLFYKALDLLSDSVHSN